MWEPNPKTTGRTTKRRKALETTLHNNHGRTRPKCPLAGPLNAERHWRPYERETGIPLVKTEDLAGPLNAERHWRLHT